MVLEATRRFGQLEQAGVDYIPNLIVLSQSSDRFPDGGRGHQQTDVFVFAEAAPEEVWSKRITRLFPRSKHTLFGRFIYSSPSLGIFPY